MVSYDAKLGQRVMSRGHGGALDGRKQEPEGHGCGEYVQADEDGDNMDFESLISQLFEVLITLIGNRRYQELMQPIVPDLIYHTIGPSPPHRLLHPHLESLLVMQCPAILPCCATTPCTKLIVHQTFKTLTLEAPTKFLPLPVAL